MNVNQTLDTGVLRQQLLECLLLLQFCNLLYITDKEQTYIKLKYNYLTCLVRNCGIYFYAFLILICIHDFGMGNLPSCIYLQIYLLSAIRLIIPVDLYLIIVRVTYIYSPDISNKIRKCLFQSKK